MKKLNVENEKMTDICSKCECVQEYPTMKDIEGDDSFDVYCDKCYELVKDKFKLKNKKMKRKNQESKKVRFDKTELSKSVIYKLEDDDNTMVDSPKYFTLNGLRFYVTDYLWDFWEDTIGENQKQDFTKLEIFENVEYLFAYLEGWMYKVSRIVIEDVK